MLTAAGCNARQHRLRTVLDKQKIDAALFTDPREIYYFTGMLTPDWLPDPATLIIETHGGSWLASNSLETDALVDERVAYVPNIGGTRNQDLHRQMVALLTRHLAGEHYARIGWQSEATPRLIAETVDATTQPDTWIAIDDLVADQERTKDADEIECLRLSIACTLAAYDAAQLAIAPNVTELIVLAAGQRSACLRAGKQVIHSGDYRCGEPGGPARDHPLGHNDLYIIDAWSHVDGYWSDLCRTFAVEQITPLQAEVYRHLADILLEVEGHLAPGLPGTELWRWIDGRIREHPHLREVGLSHHAGHGVGLRAHEGPDLNPNRGPELRPGDVISVEPGAYTPELRPGFRLENMFLITEHGCELLSSYPLTLERLSS